MPLKTGTMGERMAVLETKFKTIVEPMAKQVGEIHDALYENGIVRKVDKLYKEHQTNHPSEIAAAKKNRKLFGTTPAFRDMFWKWVIRALNILLYGFAIWFLAQLDTEKTGEILKLLFAR